MQPLSQQQNQLLKKLAIEIFVQAASAVFLAAFIGKSSLINIEHNIHLKTDPVKSCTMTVEKVILKRNKSELWYYNLPKIEESKSADTP
ncbi:MAG: hypothetical protein F6K40_21575 [Okeania sp. SIO3I5]|uniref:hypothetical protein n=1 Tax=Okeania sp. SIO3I5 TaxID=2607805 RepID=UPI0013BD5489|nr:hypothetical protein [Okeania sp. SIO3I5]NEQ38717.1 hypothetical protein [Okeania sp. SIO3I5]